LLASGARLERFGQSRPSLEQIYRRAVERVIPESTVEQMPRHRGLEDDEAAVEAATAELEAKRAARASQPPPPRPTSGKPPQVYRGRRGPRPAPKPPAAGPTTATTTDTTATSDTSGSGPSGDTE
jgi:hypothetical protein